MHAHMPSFIKKLQAVVAVGHPTNDGRYSNTSVWGKVLHVCHWFIFFFLGQHLFYYIWADIWGCRVSSQKCFHSCTFHRSLYALLIQ